MVSYKIIFITFITFIGRRKFFKRRTISQLNRKFICLRIIIEKVCWTIIGIPHYYRSTQLFTKFMFWFRYVFHDEICLSCISAKFRLHSVICLNGFIGDHCWMVFLTFLSCPSLPFFISIVLNFWSTSWRWNLWVTIPFFWTSMFVRLACQASTFFNS